jgi:phosphoserine phosphatase
MQCIKTTTVPAVEITEVVEGYLGNGIFVSKVTTYSDLDNDLTLSTESGERIGFFEADDLRGLAADLYTLAEALEGMENKD